MTGSPDQNGDRLDALLRMVVELGSAEADEIFTDERRAAQRSHILSRLAHERRRGRVIAFPAAGPKVRALRARPLARWIAMAAAAGLAIGLVVGRLSDDFSSRRRAVSSSFVPVATLPSDEDFMGEIELAGAGPVPVLLPLHELTPAATIEETPTNGQ